MKRFFAISVGLGIILVGLALFSSEPARFFGSAEAKEVINNAGQIKKTDSDTKSLHGMRNIILDPALSSTPLEASGITYLENLRSFLIISDDTERKQPDLFLMDSSGRVISRHSIRKLDEINDMESIFSAGPEVLYTLASQSYNKNGKQPLSRTLFVRIHRKGVAFEQTGSVPLFTILLDAASGSPSKKWAKFILKSDRDKTIDIEGIAVFNDTLLLGFKNPRLENRAVILAVADFNAVFSTGKLSSHQISVWRTLPLYDSVTGTFCGVSDLAVHGDKLYGVATGISSKSGIDEDIGLLWRYSPSTDSLRILRNFRGLKPEGITVYGDQVEYCIVFDNGTRIPSQLLIGKDSL
jgi:hypothetical protein